MKVFWSWQSDTPRRIGRHFVRDALNEAIEILRQPGEIEEPTERETREALHLDHDRKGVSGSPDLAPTIFRKIEAASVFVADVTLTGQSTTDDTKKFINSNVAIEYGFAVHALGDTSILMVQNTHFGDRDQLPFDLKHKAGPIQYSLSPTASKDQIDTERAALRAKFVVALRPYLEQASSVSTQPFREIPATTNAALFFDPTEVLAAIDPMGADEIQYRFSEAHPFYLRLIPTAPLANQLKVAQLMEVVERRRLDVLTRTINAGHPDRNKYGAIAFEPHGTSTTPLSLSQIFTNGEIWGVTSNLVIHRADVLLIPTTNVKNLFTRVLENYCWVASHELGIQPPYQVELGAVGINNLRLGIGTDKISGQIYSDEFKIRRVLNEPNRNAVEQVVEEFLIGLFDLAGEVRW